MHHFLNSTMFQHKSMLNKTIQLSKLCVRHFSQTTESAGLTIERLSGNRQGIVTLAMNRPGTMNALGRKAMQEFKEIMDSLRFDKTARVLIVHSLVRNTFCVGADLKERATMPEAEVAPFVSRIRQSITDLHDLPLPTMAAIDGYALGGGLELALACDLRVASSNAKMGLVETKLGIIPGGGGTQRLARIVGPAAAKELIFTARIIDGNEAYGYKLINHAVDQNSDGNAAFLKCLEMAEEIACQGPIAVRLAKLAINKGLEVDLQTGLAFEQACYAQTIATKDRMEGLMAFKEKRPPKFSNE